MTGTTETIKFPECVTTQEQKEAIFRKWRQENQGVSFQDFANIVKPTFGMNGAVTVKWCHIWLAIETDGYTHS